ncbi:MAG TPA: tetratricopeptide repeat protein [Dyella sp.]|nr:tetratricopeptide repeat protein [Dyella sp.]
MQDPPIRDEPAGPAALPVQDPAALLQAGRPQQALEAIARLPAGTTEASPELLCTRGQARLDLGEAVAAADDFAAAERLAPGNGRAALGLAMALGECGRPREAAAAAQRAIAHGDNGTIARYVLGRALLDAGEMDQAQRTWEALLASHPTHGPTLESLSGLLWMRHADLAAARRPLEQAMQAAPGQPGIVVQLAQLLDTAGEPAQAMQILEAALARMPGQSELHAAAARVALGGDPQRALQHAHRAVQASGGRRSIVATYADALLATGRVKEAADVAGRLYQADPRDSHALALLGTAGRLLGDPGHDALVDYARRVSAEPIDVPEGWSDLPAYLDDLALELATLHRWQAHPLDQSLLGGSQVALHPAHAEGPALRAFPQAIDGPIRRHLARLAALPDPTGRRAGSSYRFSGMWSVRLRPGGHHRNHFHGQGWISSACYVALPDGMHAPGGEGWLGFGQPGVPTSPALAHEYLVRPEPGLLVLFPSWMWHGTLPFRGEPQDSRLTIAFDLLPG